MIGLLRRTPSVAAPARARRNLAGSPLVPLRRSGGLPPLFYVTAGFGDILALAHLSKLLDPERPCYALQPTLDADGSGPSNDRAVGDPNEPSLDAMVGCYLRHVRTVCPEGPYLLAGNSSGGLVAFELAQRLHAEGRRVAFLGILDSPIAITPFVFALHQTVQFLAGRLLRGAWLTKDLHRSLRSLFADDGLDLQVRALRRYRPTVFPGTVTLFTAQRSHLGRNYAAPQAWRRVAGGGLVEVTLPGNHVSFLREPLVGVLAARLNELLEAACAT